MITWQCPRSILQYHQTAPRLVGKKYTISEIIWWTSNHWGSKPRNCKLGNEPMDHLVPPPLQYACELKQIELYWKRQPSCPQLEGSHVLTLAHTSQRNWKRFHLLVDINRPRDSSMKPHSLSQIKSHHVE